MSVKLNEKFANKKSRRAKSASGYKGVIFMPKRAALYIRVSSDEQARHGLSLGEQRADLIRYAKEKGYIVIGIYADEGVSARKALSRRKELQRLLSDVDNGSIDIILIKCLDRWFRSIADFYKVKERLDARGVMWECTQEKYNTTTPNGVLMLNLKLAIAQNESEQTGERVKYVFEGKKARREVVSGRVSLGLKVENKHFVPDNETLPAVAWLFDYISSGGSLNSAAVKIRDRFNLPLSRQGVYKILRNRRYIGEVYGVPDYFNAVIDKSTFARVQEILSRHKKATPSGRVYLFSGLIRCPCCGRALGGGLGRVKIKGESLVYRCIPHIGLNRTCTFRRAIYEDKVEKYLIANLQRLIRQYIIRVDKVPADGQDENSRKIKALRAKLSRLEDLYIDGMIDREKYNVCYKETVKELSELSSISAPPTVVPAALKEIADDKSFVNVYKSLDREHKQRFWQSIIKSITFQDTPETRGKGALIPFEVVFL